MPSHTGLDKWFKQDWVDIGSKKKVEALQNVEDPNKKLMPKENTQSVFQEQKQTE